MIKKNNNKNDIKYEVNVTRAKQFDNSISFDMVVNGINLYSLRYLQGEKDGEEYAFVAFPSRKGKDDKYYNYVYFKIDEKLLAEIEKQIENLL